MSKMKLGYVHTHSRMKFISLALMSFYNEKDINIGYVTLYIYKENNIVK